MILRAVNGRGLWRSRRTGMTAVAGEAGKKIRVELTWELRQQPLLQTTGSENSTWGLCVT